LNNNVGGLEHRGPLWNYLCTLLNVMRVGISRFLPGARLDHHFASCLGKHRNDHGRQRDAPFPRIDFLRNTNDHSIALCTWFKNILERAAVLLQKWLVPSARAGTIVN